jgi:hypothetical protein
VREIRKSNRGYEFNQSTLDVHVISMRERRRRRRGREGGRKERNKGRKKRRRRKRRVVVEVRIIENMQFLLIKTSYLEGGEEKWWIEDTQHFSYVSMTLKQNIRYGYRER